MTARVKVDGLPLPEYLIQLVEQGRWKVPADATYLKRVAEFAGSSDISFIRIENMIWFSERTDLFEDPKIAQVYGLASSTQKGQEITEPGLLDVDKAIMIALNWDEEAICLDYRLNLDNPCVVSGVIVEQENIVWKKIADSFQSFADHIGL